MHSTAAASRSTSAAATAAHAAVRAFHTSTPPSAALAARSVLRPLGSGTVHLQYHRHLPIALLRLDNPAKLNALSGTMMATLADHIDTLQSQQSQLAAVILAGTGSAAFCTGLDLDVAGQHVRTPDAGKQMADLMHDSLTRLRRLSLVSFAAVEGHAVGGGAELTTATDFRVMTFGAAVRFVHLKMGAAPGWGGGFRLTQLVGHTRALQLLLSCKKLDGEAASKLGLAQWTCPSGQALAKCVDVLEGYLGVSIPEDARERAMAQVRRRRAGRDADDAGVTDSSGAIAPEDQVGACVDDEAAIAAEAAWVHFTPNADDVPWFKDEVEWAGNSLTSVRAMKTDVIAAMDYTEDKALEIEKEAFVTCWGSEHNAAALNKRKASPAGSTESAAVKK
ncbi:ClpP/crotonase-like domain-containing protein [Catenaria anguillulae PL171]|uniref:ClpP/crotonase-like domain-containing protein n=1 Tax=Catenaria anguillulae PL171 TaxID=765915 RepID=A0A1Y2I1X7_9FUNG|nr:ClpP/crotonase-like domain-containing protein [Catenaria anguillulae PL171]